MLREPSLSAVSPDQAAEAGAREKVRVTPAQTLAHMTQLIMPQHANSLGITFGGQVGVHALRALLPAHAPHHPRHAGPLAGCRVLCGDPRGSWVLCRVRD